MAEETKVIDESLYSRQLYIIDHASMKRVMASNVLILGLGGLGVETAKNVILTGVKSVTLWDDQNTSYLDLASQFYLSESDIGKNRAEASVSKLTELNEHVDVQLYLGELTEEFLSKFQVIVATNIREDEQVRLNSITRKLGSMFISGEIRGVFSRAFCDFGENFTVYDVNGEPASSYIISSISSGEKTTITVNEDTRLTLESGDHVTFSDVTGYENLNDISPTPVEVHGPFSFTVNIPTNGSAHASGYVKEVKVPKSFSFKPLSEQIEKPDFIYSDFAKSPEQLHAAFCGLHQFWKQSNKLPSPQNIEEFQSTLSLVNELNEKCKFTDKVNEDLVKSLSFTSIASINPLAAFLGGVIGQEVLKACTGKFTPIRQWLYFDAIETLPENITSEKFLPLNSRYDSNIIVFGSDLQDQILNSNYFLVGSGAIGCEMLKNWAELGLGCGNGAIHVTDMDNIEKSNLNRQFLFRPKDIGSPKSEAAAEAAKVMNPNLNIKVYTNRVGEDTEHIFNDQFFESLNGVCNALDNVDARMYMDGRCIHYKLPLLESGTLGTKANSQVIVPFLTESYSSSRDPPEKTIPMCTLHHFPNRIEHTIQWSRDEFEGLFRNTSENVNAFLSNPNYLDSLEKQNFTVRLETVKSIYASLITEKPTSFDQCIAWARLKFEEFFANNIKQLLFNFPADLITSSGLPFWSGSKRAPKPIEFDPTNSLHIDFIIATANLRAFNFGLKGNNDKDYIRDVAERTPVPLFVPAKGVHIPADDKSNNENSSKQISNVQQDEALLQNYTNEITTVSSNLVGFRTFPIEFEKDDDSNFHIDFITSCSNLRATNYSIPVADRHTTKGIAGKIIPAMVTTTAMITGLVCIELLKVIQQKKIDQYKNGFVNLSLPFFGFSEPIPPATTKIREGWEWNLWDRFEVSGPLTLQQLIDHFLEKYKLEISMVSAGMTLMYAFFMKKPVLEERLNLEIAALYEKVSHKTLHEKETSLILTLCASRDEDKEDVDIPWVHYRFSKN